jgi:hypothetical protein
MVNVIPEPDLLAKLNVGVVVENAIELLAALAVDDPLALTATIVNVYPVFEANDAVPVSGVDVPLVDTDTDGLDVVVYEEIAFPPVAPAVNGIETVVPFVLETVPIVGACGTVVAVIAEEALDADEFPAAFDATTVNV